MQILYTYYFKLMQIVYTYYDMYVTCFSYKIEKGPTNVE